MVYLFVSLICWLIAANAVVELPPDGLYFQLKGIKDSMFGFGGDCIVGAADGSVFPDSCDDSKTKQFWTVYDVQSDNSFKLKNERRGTCIYKKSSSVDFTDIDDIGDLFGDGVALGPCSSTGNEYYWKLNNPGNTWFRLKNKDSDKCISAMSMWNVLSTASCSDVSTKWKFLFEDYEVVSVELHADLAEIVRGPPVVASTTTCDNREGGSGSTEVSLTWSESRESTTSFEFSYGLEISVGTEFTTKAPLVAEASVSIDVTNSFQWTWGEEVTEGQEFAGTYTFPCNPGELIEGSAMLWANDYNIPFTMTLQSVRNPSFFFESVGIWKKVNHYFFAVSTACLTGCD